MQSFEDFLVENQARLLNLDAEGVAVFSPDRDVSAAQVAEAENRLGLRLPNSYKQFLSVCGSGEWCGDFIPQPSEIYAFDQDCGDMEGFVALVHNVRGVGDFVAMNPHEQTTVGEYALYYCSHDPFGFGKVASSFESWAREAVAAMESGSDPYDAALPAVEQTWRDFSAKSKKWWQFWR